MCNCCDFKAPLEAFDGLKLGQSEVILNVDLLDKYEKNEDDNKGVETEHVCPKCGYDLSTLKTMQLRGADEGQTCFYTCLKCGFTDKEDG